MDQRLGHPSCHRELISCSQRSDSNSEATWMLRPVRAEHLRALREAAPPDVETFPGQEAVQERIQAVD